MRMNPPSSTSPTGEPNPQDTTTEKPRIFIGSSSEARSIAETAERALKPKFRVDIWSQDFFEPTNQTLSDLVLKADRYDLGLFVFAPDDRTTIRGRRLWTTRDNVVLEYGIFLASIGEHQCFILRPVGTQCRVPTDIDGITTLIYTWRRSRWRMNNLSFDVEQSMQALKEAVGRKKQFLSGVWNQNWKVSDSPTFPVENPSTAVVFHFENRFRAEFKSLGLHYEAIGRISGQYISGSWKDIDGPEKYHGTFQLRMDGNAQHLNGSWLGYSSTQIHIRHGAWTWKRVNKP